MAVRELVLNADMLLRAYRLGMFPMAETRRSKTLHFLDPDRRGVLPLNGFHLPRRLYRTLRTTPLVVAANRDFPGLIATCAASRALRPETWINREIEQLFVELHNLGHAHSVEVWDGAQLVGGLYGLAIGGAFFGESMVSLVRDASKLALAHLVARLRLGGFALLDTQFLTDHLARFGAREVSRATYHELLAEAVALPARWSNDLDQATIMNDIATMLATNPKDPT
ncbi:MAG: leucyl/phenylalanyl-tRNA--protein transferase [Acidiphilium sp.]|nr:leucyl/phenylalanyl-tRNA--protein transferase [Acidiphilium sp.]MDD4935481.1 leucyl/phenylalanyl-tRNA--protein transferase [Acidiphilium sp.]